MGVTDNFNMNSRSRNTCFSESSASCDGIVTACETNFDSPREENSSFHNTLKVLSTILPKSEINVSNSSITSVGGFSLGIVNNSEILTPIDLSRSSRNCSNQEAASSDGSETSEDVKLSQANLQFNSGIAVIKETASEFSGEKECYKCDLVECGASFDKKWRFESHLQFHEGKVPFRCTFPGCKKEYVNIPNLEKHQFIHENATATPQVKEVTKKEKSSQKNLKCPIKDCDASFSRKWRLESHIYGHIGEKPFKCPVFGCYKEYSNLPHLKRHQSLHHSASPPPNRQSFPCSHPGCDKILKTKQNLQKHILRAHTEKEFKCPHCPESFSKKAKFDVHMYGHGGPPPIRCGVCSIGFCHKREYNRHMRSHRLHICPIKGCAEVFDDYKILRKHIAALHPPRYECDFCYKRIRSKLNLRKHIDRHIEAINGVRPFRRQSLPKGPFMCDICSMALTTKASMLRHKAKKHGSSGQEDSPLKLEKPKTTLIRAPRWDIGIPTSSLAAVLSGIELPHLIQKELIRRRESSPIQSLNAEIERVLVEENAPDQNSTDS